MEPSKNVRRVQESGAPLKFAQERLGHASATTTLNNYTHVVSDQGLAEKVQSAFPIPSVSLTLAATMKSVSDSSDKVTLKQKGSSI
jgi:hypothetical protein